MKTFKLTTILVAIASIVTLTSCLDNNYDGNSTNYAKYTSYVTLSGSSIYDYTYYSDLGYRLTPTLESASNILKGLENSNGSIKRLAIGFDMADGTTPTLQAGKNYNVELKPFNYGGYLMNYIAVPTYNTINTAQNENAVDSLTTKNKGINSVNGEIWAANGYVNGSFNIKYNPSSKFYFNTYYNSETDVDITHNKLYLNLYYNYNSDHASNTGTDVFSFALPSETYSMFTGDSISIVLRAKTNTSLDNFSEVGTCKISREGLRQPF